MIKKGSENKINFTAGSDGQKNIKNVITSGGHVKTQIESLDVAENQFLDKARKLAFEEKTRSKIKNYFCLSDRTFKSKNCAKGQKKGLKKKNKYRFGEVSELEEESEERSKEWSVNRLEERRGMGQKRER